VTLLGEPRGVVGVLEHRLRQVRPAHRLAGGLALGERRRVDGEAELLEPLRHGVRPALAIGARVAQALLEQRAAVVDPVPEHVQVLVLPVHGRDLGGGRDAHSVEGPGRERLVHAVHRVVVGEGEQLHAGLCGVRHHVGHRKRAVGVERMRLEIERRRVHTRQQATRRESRDASCSR
jgi:hypothetical protein